MKNVLSLALAVLPLTLALACDKKPAEDPTPIVNEGDANADATATDGAAPADGTDAAKPADAKPADAK